MSQSPASRILVLSFSFSPMRNARAFRWQALCTDFVARGMAVDVVTSWSPGAAERETLDGVEVWRTGWTWLETLRGVLQRRRQALPPGAAMSSAPPPNRLRHRMFRWLAKAGVWLWRRLYWPDTTCLWYFPARALAARLMNSNRYDAVISVSPTFTAVLVGRAVTRNGRRARWLLDLGDPFSFQTQAPPNNFKLYESLNTRVERAAFVAAHAVSVTTEATARIYQSVFPESAAKVHVIPPLLSMPAAGSVAPLHGDSGTALRMVFVGTLYQGLREPDFLLQLVAAVNRRPRRLPVELHFFGDVSACATSFAQHAAMMGKTVHRHGVVSREVVAGALGQAHVVVNIGNDTAHQLPSKVVEYAVCGKPILNIARIRQDSSMAFFRDHPDRLLMINEDGVPTQDQIEEFEHFLEAMPRSVPEAILSGYRERFSIERVGARYLGLMA